MPGNPIDLFIVSLAVLAPALGGATELWAQAILWIGLAGLLVWRPPRMWPPVVTCVLFVVVLALAALGFLPATWFKTSSFRQAIEQGQILALSPTLSLQPWQTLEGFLLLAGGLVWTAYLVGHRWSSRRATLLSVYAIGVLGLAGLALFSFFSGWQPAFWHPANGAFGFFPNRSETGIILATGGVITLALAFRMMLRRRLTGFFWAVGYFFLLGALAVNRDETALVLCLAGSGVWLVWATWPSRQQRTLGIGLAATLLVPLALLLVFGVLPEPKKPLPDATTPPYSRWKVQADAIRLLPEASWHGIGLGNFEAVFARNRTASLGQNRVLHPENDWLWAGIELGWLAPVALAAALFSLARGHWPQPSRVNFRLRSALMVCVGLFLVDGLLHVPGHRLGALWPCLLFFALAREFGTGSRALPGLSLSSRALGLGMAGIAFTWLASGIGYGQLPTSARAEWVRRQIGTALRIQQFDRAIAWCGVGLRWAPLDWELYFERALAEVASLPSINPAVMDFSRARFLEPNSIQVPAEEARIWLSRAPRLAFPAWVEVLRRAGDRKSEAFRTILEMGRGIPEVREELFSLTYKDPELLMVFLEYASPEEFRQELDKLLKDDPDLKSLTKEQRAEVFRFWAQKGDTASFERHLQAHPEWLDQAWAGLAQVTAGRGEWKQACALAQKYAPVPVLPKVSNSKPAAALAHQLALSSNDFASGYALFQLQTQARDLDGASETMARLTNQKDCPAYFHFLEAQLQMERGEWKAAWQAWEQYLNDLALHPETP